MLFPALFFLKFFDDHIAAHFREMINKKFAVAVVGFVKKGAGGVTFRLALEPFAFLVLRSKARLHRADDDRRNFADRQTAFLTGLLAARFDDFGVGGN
jgi:hypothetical protein